MNKRGQERGILKWILGIAAVVIILIFIVGPFGLLEDIFASVDDYELKVSTCEGYVVGKRVASYCQRFDELEVPGYGEKIFVNCEFADIERALKETLDCPNNEGSATEASLYCGKIGDDKKDRIVNGETCSKHLGPGAAAE